MCLANEHETDEFPTRGMCLTNEHETDEMALLKFQEYVDEWLTYRDCSDVIDFGCDIDGCVGLTHDQTRQLIIKLNVCSNVRQLNMSGTRFGFRQGETFADFSQALKNQWHLESIVLQGIMC